MTDVAAACKRLKQATELLLDAISILNKEPAAPSVIPDVVKLDKTKPPYYPEYAKYTQPQSPETSLRDRERLSTNVSSPLPIGVSDAKVAGARDNSATKPQAKFKNAQDLRQAFPPNLKITVTEATNHYNVHSEWVATDLWDSLNEIARTFGGRWVKDGASSRWEIPK